MQLFILTMQLRRNIIQDIVMKTGGIQNGLEGKSKRFDESKKY